ncbi:MAG: PSD1 and planctomycete cytochrome C domain-containing protein [Verrucomicrobia bacterium]|nr:PSD1 and planctomycete cytochrome C domain-containing protein [Verrucomicrobiota bacterium]MDA1065829.1 PSD1 and planctomycete cytochrome C domain-containing protein [Verrucomicrobiota bacterium]
MKELEILIQRMLDGKLSSGDHAKLSSLLKNNPEFQAYYAQQCQLHAELLLNDVLRNSLPAAPPIDEELPAFATDSATGRKSSWIPFASMVAASVAITLTVVIVYQSLKDTQESQVTEENLIVAKTTTPQELYNQTLFSESGSLQRPPTPFVNASADQRKTPVSFNNDIRPILSENCYACHGPDAEAREADLRLDVEEWAFRERKKGPPAIVRGDPDNSPVYQRITNPLKSEIMPPQDSHKVLTPSQKQLIGQWIAEGAKWEGHWAFIRPTKPTPPEVSWGNNEIDKFTYAAMQEKGLSPNEEADRPTLARRLALDLTGLPPTPELVSDFVADKSATAYETLVDKLLTSSTYGEHQARFWLDAARYADTHGLHLDNYREIWPYRDWVVKSFNENKPFDQFTIEQIAGDLLPQPTIEQRLATGFNRCNPTTSEGGAIDEEYRAIYAKDRVETTATVFMGLTMGCASCHDHKFDPFTTKDFYKFSAFFNNFDGPIMDGNAYDTRPVIAIPKADHTEEWKQVKAKGTEISKALSKLEKSNKTAYEAWQEQEEVPFVPVEKDLQLAFELKLGKKDKESPAAQKITDHIVKQASLGDLVNLSEAGFDFDPDKPFTLDCQVKLPGEKSDKLERIPVIEQFDGDRGWRLSIANTSAALPNRYQITFELIHSLKNNDLISATAQADRFNPREVRSTNIRITYDGSRSVAGLTINAGSRQPFDYEKVIDNLSGTVATDAPLQAGLMSTGIISKEQAVSRYNANDDVDASEDSLTGDITNIKFYNRTIYPFELGNMTANKLAELLSIPKERRRGGDASSLEAYYYSLHVPEYTELKLAEAINDRLYNHIYDQAIVSLVMEEKDSLPSAFMLERGEYDKPGDEVFADIPESLGGLPSDAPKNRLGLANWLVDDSNPLTARVTVNRFWQNIFGAGLVATSEDFGLMGENPSHPELLDWLAIHFQETDWNVKAFIKTLVMSATYRQTSTIQPSELSIDRENLYLARGPRYRLDGEVLRDKALYVSGSLNPKVGGPPVKPYQPEGIWNAVAYSDSNTAHFSQDQGEALYRRSLYTFWKRTAPPPNMVVFDVPSRENCNVRRERTNTPLQALTLMNDPQFVEAARQLAERTLASHSGSTSEKIGQMYTYAFGSGPIEKHHDILTRSYDKFHDAFKESPKDARSLIEVGDSFPNQDLDPVELASLTMVANQIMNLDSFINKY